MDNSTGCAKKSRFTLRAVTASILEQQHSKKATEAEFI